jgi:photosystem II stability/assembly factor-like uncharacterized protein
MQTSRKPARRPALLVVAGLVVVLVALEVATTRSLTPRFTGQVAQVVAPPEREGRLPPGRMQPDEFLDLKQSSARPVTEAQVTRAQAQAADVPAAPNPTAWQQIGPANIGGRVTDLVVDRAAPDSLYVAVSGGGIWKSSDAGVTFAPVWPSDHVQSMGAVAQGPDGTLWAGTGEANPPGGGLTYFGDGLYKSTDGGANWQNVGLRESASIGRLAVDPTNPNRVFAAAAGHVARSAGQRGLYRTTDGGGSWQLVLAPPNATTGAIDVAIDPTNPQRVFAALWDHKRNNGARVYGGIGSGLFRSDDGGDTWKRLENVIGALPPYDQTQTGLKADASLGRIGVTIAPSDHNRVYVVSGSPYGPDKGFFVSNDGGDSFVAGAGRAYQTSSGYQWWFGRLWVDPVNKDHIFNADVNLRMSNNAGATWAAVGGVHADQHGMDFDPRVPGRVYLGNDGGVYHSSNNGATWLPGTYQPWNQSYHLAVAKDDPTRLATGLQDNGSKRTWTPAAPPGDLSQWFNFGNGDGHNVLIDPTDHNTYYECFQPSPPNQSCSGHADVNGVMTSWSFSNAAWSPTQQGQTPFRWTTDTPIVLDPTDSKVVYIGGQALARSTDQGRHFTLISPRDDTQSLPGPVPADENDLGPFYANEYATISAIAPAKTAPSTIYVGTDTGRLWKTTDLGAHWTRFSGLPERWVNSIVVDPTDPDHVFVAFSGFREGDDAANVWMTFDGGRTWSNISGRLPNAPVDMLAYDQPRHQLVAATDLGVFYLRDERKKRSGWPKHWLRLGTGLPNTPVLDLKLTGDGRSLYAATFGRSVWKVPLPRN